METSLNQLKRKFEGTLTKLAEEVKKLEDYGSKMMRDAAVQQCELARQMVQACLAEKARINTQEEHLAHDISEYKKLTDSSNQLEPFERLWKTTKAILASLSVWTK
jgi:hypothetical protein